MEVSLVRHIASNLLERYGSNAADIAAHAARQTQRDGDADGTKSWRAVHTAIQTLRTAPAGAKALDILV
jgi:hypothetical protein